MNPQLTSEARFRPSNHENMRILEDILTSLANAAATDQAAKALSLVSSRVDWLYSTNLPELMNMLCLEHPSYRDDPKIQGSYEFILSFLESMAKEMNVMISSNQLLLRKILEAAKVSEQTLDTLFEREAQKILAPEFLVYLDSEIESHEMNSPSQRILVTIKLKILDAIGKTKGDNVMAIARIVSEDRVQDIEQQTKEYLKAFDQDEKELFLQTLRLMQQEMRKRYQSVDIILVEKLRIIEATASKLIQ